MNFEHTDKVKELLARLERFMDKHIYPNEKTYDDQMKAFREAGNPWQVPQILEDLKPKAKEEGLWNLFLPHEYGEFSPGLTNLEYASASPKSWAACRTHPNSSTARRPTPATWK